MSSAVAARLLAARVGLPEGECYTIALLRGIGWLVLERFAEKNALPIPDQVLDDPASVAKWERQVFGLSAAEAALRVLKLWNFAPPAVAALRRLGKRPYTDPTTALLAIANAIGDRLGLGLEVERGRWIITPQLLKVVGLDPERVEEIVHETQGEMEKLRKIVVHSTLPAADGHKSGEPSKP
ncbi:MAG: HDOD domain-containing protein [Opitutus sp.]|nr:HDOD domain-containing protein [Opitutus sp.]MCS6247841.1 HDOD domain-containing protein [Opitutus sp.]MCS6274310.1 HDOD domain-containing protein [Opitutus sp.]MCS6276514.1 HDOD domain-containing protein [Opitutus sp.]MCS6301838.1 HDOD domain-containing protein [Opitutus sp.]